MTNHGCVCCNWLKPNDCLEAVVVGSETFYACDVCTDNLEGPGKHQGVSEDDFALCIVLEHLAGISMEDHMLTDENYGYLGVFDRYMLLEDDRGFVEVRTFADADAAMREANSFEDDGFGADQFDAWITDEWNGYAVSFDGKYVDRFARLNRAKAMVALLMRDNGYFPNVWHATERGSVRRIDIRPLTDKEN